MKKVIGFSLVVMGLASAAFATAVPEIDGASATSAVALLTGLALVIRSRK